MNPQKITCPNCHNDWWEFKSDPPAPVQKKQVIVREKCSRCGSKDIQVYEPPIFEHATRLSVGMRCQDCGHKWHEYFDLTEIVEEND